MNAPRQILKGFFYTIASGYGARLGSVILTLLLKRTLGPEIFDRVLEATIVFLMLSTLGQFGQVHALLHYQKQAGEFVQTHFTLNLIVSAIVLAISCVVALTLFDPAVSGAESWAALVICTFAGLRFIRNTSMTSEGLMRSGLQFGRLSALHGIGTIAALGAALIAASRGWGEWSLLIGGWTTYATFSLVYVVIFAGGVWFSQPLKPWKLQLDPVWTKRLLSYGLGLWIGWVLQAFVWYYGWLVLKHFEGERELTLYEHAWWLMQIPTALISHIIFNYTNTLYSRYQNDRPRLGELFSRMLGLIVRVSAPLALIFVLNADEVVSLSGERWAGAAPILVWLAAYGFVRPLLDEGTSLLWAVGATRRTAQVMAGLALIAAPLIPIAAAKSGVQGVAYSMGLLAALGVAGTLATVRSQVTFSWRPIFAAPVTGLAVMAAAGLGYSRWAGTAVSLESFAARCALMVLAYAATLALLDRTMIRESLGEIRRILDAGKSPATYELIAADPATVDTDPGDGGTGSR